MRLTRLQRRVAELISEWEAEGFDDVRDAGQEAQELLTALSKTAPERAEVERVRREVIAVLDGKPTETLASRSPRTSRRPPTTSSSAR